MRGEYSRAPISRRTFLGGGAAILAYSLASPSAALAHGTQPHGGYPDALTHYALDGIKIFTRWLHGKKGYVGEVSFPQNLTRLRSEFHDEELWAALGERWYDYVDNQHFWVTAHTVSERYYNLYDGGYPNSVWLCPGGERFPSEPRPKVISRPGYQAALVKRHRGPYRGVNFSNAQKWDRGVHSSYKPGRYGIDYWYPTVSDYPRDPGVNGGKDSYEYLYSEGVRLIRLGFRWERIQPRLGHNLDRTELGRMKQSVRNADRAGLKVILELHNMGGYWKTTSGGADGHGKVRLNSAGCTKQHLQGVWRRLSSWFRDDPAVVGYDLMNEPTGEGGIAPSRGKSLGRTWEEITTFVHAGLRRSGDKKTIIIPTYGFWPRVLFKYHPRGPWIRGDRNVRYTIHQYFDHHDGVPMPGAKYQLPYWKENAFRRSQGY